MANNFTALFHACGSSIFALSYLMSGDKNTYYFLKKFSTGYFLYDTHHTAKYLKQPLSSMYIYHHLATTYYIHQNPEIYKTGQIMFLAELSNIPSYFVYYYLKTNNYNSKNKLMLYKKIQKLLYTIIRIPILGLVGYSYFNNSMKEKHSLIPYYTTLPVYILGIMWTFKIINK